MHPRQWIVVLAVLTACGGGGAAGPGATDVAEVDPGDAGPDPVATDTADEPRPDLGVDVAPDPAIDLPIDIPDPSADRPDLPDDRTYPDGIADADDSLEIPEGLDIPDVPDEDEAVPDILVRCPSEMARVDGVFCIDRWEAALEEWTDGTWTAASPWQVVGSRTVRAVSAAARVPQAYVSGDEAGAACEASGKRLCTSDEWLSACRGPNHHVWPYGDAHVDGACNDGYAGSPVVAFFGTDQGVWDSDHLNDPGIDQQAGTVSPAGAHPLCVSDWGVYDLHGNLSEWVADAEGTFRGGYYADGAINGAGCLYTTTAHTSAYHDYSTGFRCCLTLE